MVIIHKFYVKEQVFGVVVGWVRVNVQIGFIIDTQFDYSTVK